MWPRAKSFLLDTTSVEYVRLDSGEDDNENPLPIALQVVVAAQQGANSILPALPGAATEATAIGQAMMSAAIPIQIPGATRTAVTSALQEPGAWVHIAAHGMAQPQRIGFAGIWLEPIGDELAPQFLSWIDVLDSGVSADLVVLNACQLADSGTAVNGNLSFADAVSRAGAKHVVASLWPVSDAASALWVPAFYGAITADPYHDPAAALRAAQLRLRESRAFRHPFFWAGMQVIDRMPIGSKATH
jgi:CHAT domain-containing protein